MTPSGEEETGDGTAGPDLLDSPVEAAARAPSSLSPAVYRVPNQYAYHRKRERRRDEVEPRELPKSSTNALLGRGSESRRCEQLTEAALAALCLRSSALALASVQHVPRDEVSPVRQGGHEGVVHAGLPSTTEAETPPSERLGRAGVAKAPEKRLPTRCWTMIALAEATANGEPQPKPPAVDLQLLPRAARQKVSPFPHVLLLAQLEG